MRYFEKITAKQLAEYDLIIAADVCFWDELADTLYKRIKRACKAGVGKIIIADPERSPFFELSERCVDKFYAELEPWSVDEPLRASASLLIIENA
jgi:predicted nicotinamide N-methyase